MVVMPSGMPAPGTESARLCMLTCCGKRPVISEEREGEQNLYVLRSGRKVSDAASQSQRRTARDATS